jgi:hypothetical protein
MIQINLLSHSLDRFDFTIKSLEFLRNIKEVNKKKVKLVIMSSVGDWDGVSYDMNQSGIHTEVLKFNNTGNNYLSKINYAVQSECEYSCSMDDDILISTYLWDYIIENIHILNDNTNLLIAPIISNGIPSVELFMEDFLTSNQSDVLKSIFLNTKIENHWNVDYSSLNKSREVWDFMFYKDVSNINHHYKGIHPIRVSYDAQRKLVEYICENKERILSDNIFKLESYRFPYFCNSFFFIKTSIWKSIIENKSLYRDEYDEVPLNLYMQLNNLNIVFVRNGGCVHMAYNTIGTEKQKDIERYFSSNFL